MSGVVIAQVLLVLVLGLWIAARFRDSPIIKFFGRNDWFVGAFLVLVGYINYITYAALYVRNLNLVLIVIGIILIAITVIDVAKK